MRRNWNVLLVPMYVQGVTDNYKNTDDLLVTFTGPDELSDLLREYRDQLDEIKMCVDPDWMPFEAISESGELMGISSELFPMLARQIGKPIRLVVTETWSESMDRARKGECDILSLASPTEERRKDFLFTDTLFSIPTVIATQDDQLYIEGIDQILDREIGVVKGYAFIDVIRERYPSANIVEVESGKHGLRMVQDGELFAFIDYAASVVDVIRNEGLTNVRISGEAGFPMKISVATRIEEPLLHKLFNHAINEIGQEKIQALYNRNVAVNYTKGVDYSLIWQVVLGAALVLSYSSDPLFPGESF
jgi:ABC-type amino acid transport substrate-binding protein